MSNRKLGENFEVELAEILFNNGYWVHRLKQNADGQPADIIAVKNRKAYLIDAKVCSNGFFDCSRVEPNQHLAMKMWENCGNHTGWFALKFDDRIAMLPAYVALDDNVKKVNRQLAENVCIPLEMWMVVNG